jgi:TolB-like protein/AraC-like DNA-binding protein/Tfp pilus assembly protein PilF
MEKKIKSGQKAMSKTIAVLPLVNRSANQENEYFSDGMTEEIINALTKIKELKVISRTSSFYFKNKNIPIRQIGEALNVSTILEGSVRLSGKRMRLTAQLIDVANDVHFWSVSFDRMIDDIFTVQDEISLLIADKLREHLGHLEINEHLIHSKDVPVETYQNYLKSRYHILKMTQPDIEKGISILEQILSDSPNFAPAHLSMHLGYTLMGTIGFMPAGEAFSKGHSFLEKAIELDPNLPECQLHLSYLSLLQEWDLKKTYYHLNKSYEISPVVEYYQSMASTLVAERKFVAAHHYIDIALQLDPFSSINFHLKGFIYYAQEQFEEAIQNFRRAIELKKEFMASTIYLGQALLLSGKIQESFNYFQNLPENSTEALLKLGGTTLALGASGKPEQAEEGLKKLEAALNTEAMGRALNILILCHTVMGNYDKALAFIKQGLDSRLPMFVYLNVEPILKPLHSRPEYRDIIHKILGSGTNIDLPKRKYKKALFDKTELTQNKGKLKQLMTTDKPYLDPNLTLRSLSEKLQMSPNHLSQLLNEGFDKNFSEYINTYRLETFKEKAADASLGHLTILALAYESGFNSKTVFNTFFKRTVGMTPKEYWKKVAQ